jgi:hypothetical protein
MLVSSTAAAAIAGTLSHRKKPYFFDLAQELIDVDAKPLDRPPRLIGNAMLPKGTTGEDRGQCRTRSCASDASSR